MAVPARGWCVRYAPPAETMAGVAERDEDHADRGEVVPASLSVRIRRPSHLEQDPLVQARLLLIHPPERDHAQHRLIGAARPGGYVMIGDVDITTVRCSSRTRR